MTSRSKNAWINSFFLVVTLAINALGATGLINGLSQKEVSDRYLTLITPSPSTFSIWSVIYILLFASIIVMIVKKDDGYYQRAIDEVTGLFRISCLFNVAWIVAFSYLQITLSTLFIAGFVVTLSTICLRLLKIQEGGRFLLPLTFGLYAGWVFIATVVNVAAALVKLGFGGFGIGEEIWAAVTLGVAVMLVFLVLTKLRNVAFPLPAAWGFWGIYQFLISPEGFKGVYSLLQTVSLVGMVVLIGLAGFQFYRNRFHLLPGV